MNLLAQPRHETAPFTQFMLGCWKAHTRKPELTRERLEQAVKTTMDESQLIELSALICHINGEHMGDWIRGSDYYRGLHGRFPDLGGIARHRLARQAATLDKAQHPGHDLITFEPRDQFYITALALPAAALQASAAAGRELLGQTLNLLETIAPDPDAQRMLAIVTANLTCDMLERYELAGPMRSLLMAIAQISSELWQAIGNGHDQARAEYRLAVCRIRFNEPIGNGSGRYARFESIAA